MRLTVFFALVMTAPGAVNAAEASDPHAHHHMNPADVRVSLASYDVPDVELRDEQGRSVRLRELLANDRPLAVNFVYTSCTSICPVMTATFMQMQRNLAADATRPQFVSITIDPDFDTAPTLKSYAQRFGASWSFLTGPSAEVMSVLRAFDAYRGNKVNHAAVTLLRAPRGKEWTRVEGLASSEQLVQMWKDLASS